MSDCVPSMPAVLMVVDQLPYPPRNGVTLPTFHYADGLRKTCALDLVLMVDEAHALDPDAIAENEAIFGKIRVIRMRRKGKIRRVLDEMLARDMFNQGWDVADAPLELKGCKANVLLAAPFSAAAKWAAAGLSGPENFACRIAAVNDCTTAEYYYRCAQDFGSVREIAKGRLDRVRSSRIARVECRVLSDFQYLLMQTPTDRGLMKTLVGDSVAERVVLVPNGVRRDFFDICRDPGSNTFVFVAELSSEYASIADWLVREVWPEVTAANSDARLLIVGKGASPALIEAIATGRNIDHVAFVDDLRTVYSAAAGAICPVFKGYGLINKALESMAAGVPVIGGAAAFNGIGGFVSGVHGFVCRPRHTREFASAICRLLADRELAATAGEAGRSLIDGQFRWESAVRKIEALVSGKAPHD